MTALRHLLLSSRTASTKEVTGPFSAFLHWAFFIKIDSIFKTRKEEKNR